jgi:hypothetical protein
LIASLAAVFVMSPNRLGPLTQYSRDLSEERPANFF